MVWHVEKSCKGVVSSELFASSIRAVINLLKLVSIERALQKVNRYNNASVGSLSLPPSHAFLFKVKKA